MHGDPAINEYPDPNCGSISILPSEAGAFEKHEKVGCEQSNTSEMAVLLPTTAVFPQIMQLVILPMQ
jgi:hypothetical protein